MKSLRKGLAAAVAMAMAGGAWAGFGDGLSSAAADGIGNAAAARGPEAGSLFTNPGALARLDRGDVTVMYAKPLTGIPDISVQQGVAAVAVPVGASFTLSGGARYFDDASLSKESEGALGLSSRMGPVSLGAAGVFLQRKFDVSGIPGASSDPVLSKGSSKSGVGVDAGVQYQAARDLTVGAAGRNLNRPNLGLATEDKVPTTWRAGLAYKMGSFTFLGEARGQSQSTSADSKWGAGVEWRAASPLTLRVGGDDKEFAAGLGLSFRDLRLDYAFSFLQSLGAATGADHRISLGYRFGTPRGEEAPAPVRRVQSRAQTKPAAKATGRPAAQPAGRGTSTRDSRAYPTTPQKPSKKVIRAWD